METITLKAPDISCGHCVAAITSAVGALDGAQVVASDISGKQVTVEYDPNRVSLDQIEHAMDEEGYPVAR